MSINLEYILKRNKSNLDTFIKKNELTSYDKLLEYCEMRKFIPCTEEEYDKIANKKVANKKVEVQDEPKVNREASKAQKPKKRRYRRKKQQDTPKLPNSTDKR